MEDQNKLSGTLRLLEIKHSLSDPRERVKVSDIKPSPHNQRMYSPDEIKEMIGWDNESVQRHARAFPFDHLKDIADDILRKWGQNPVDPEPLTWRPRIARGRYGKIEGTDILFTSPICQNFATPTQDIEHEVVSSEIPNEDRYIIKVMGGREFNSYEQVRHSELSKYIPEKLCQMVEIMKAFSELTIKTTYENKKYFIQRWKR